ncbi:hypothetical protein FPZ12_004750 [Amycolatopsis acidicola]|uniref:Uncharacterized protein n=1 Tax=Amycolatopsis acidicola TaxID=2596893 RepID=A0A5N0VHF0_9PSEU|nr:hypothetical protein [Amycolatopsis acidicola]KAA9165797.1 hypothetical protein FPZ12_004750 [Amycolatopsis acidicola]
MDHGTHGATGSVSLDVTALLVRLALLLATAIVAGGGLFEAKPRFTLAGVSAALAAVSAIFFDVNVVAAVIHAVLVLAVPLLLARKLPVARWVALALLVLVVVETSMGRSGIEFAADTVYVAGATAWFGLAQLKEKPPRYGALTLSLGLLLVVAGAGQLLLSGVAFDRRLYETLFGWSLVVVVVVPLVVVFLRGRRWAPAGIVVAFLAWTTFVALPAPAVLPVPGVPLLTTASVGGQDIPVLVSPQRPGRNLVHVPASAGAGLSIAGVPLTQRAGAQGYWAEVDLPSGRSDLDLGNGSGSASFEVDAGSGAPVVTNQDSPECASAALGGLVAGRKAPLARCPADYLSDDDADALRKLVGFLASRHANAIRLVGDTSRRGVASADVVRTSAQQQGIRLTDTPEPNAALVVVSGWTTASSTLTQAAEAQRSAPTYTYGLYLAPWLLTGPLANTVSASTVPLRFDPREQTAVTYTVALGDAFGGESPTVDGFHQWLGTAAPQQSVQLFSSAQVSAMPMYPGEPEAPGMPMYGEGPGHWIPQATVVPVSSPLE